MAVLKSNLTLRLELEKNAKIKYIAKRECRSVTSKISYLIQQEIERYEAEHGPIPISDDDLYGKL